MTDDDYTWCPDCAGFGAVDWVVDSNGGHWKTCVRCGGLGLVPRRRPTRATGDGTISERGAEEYSTRPAPEL